MTDFFRFPGWLFVNVGIPVLAPLILLPLLKLGRSSRNLCRNVVSRAVPDGQLFWTVIAMSAAACYDLGGALNGQLSTNMRTFVWCGLVWHIFFIVVSAILVLIGTIDSLQQSSGIGDSDVSGQSLMHLSILITIIISATFSLVHYSVT